MTVQLTEDLNLFSGFCFSMGKNEVVVTRALPKCRCLVCVWLWLFCTADAVFVSMHEKKLLSLPWTNRTRCPVSMLVMAINLSIGYICTYIPIDLCINRYSAQHQHHSRPFFLRKCLPYVLICLAQLLALYSAQQIASHISSCNVYRANEVYMVFFLLVVGSFNLPMFWRCTRNAHRVYLQIYIFAVLSA